MMHSNEVWKMNRNLRLSLLGAPGHGVRLCTGMVIAIEPRVNAGVSDVRELPDGWTVKTADGALSAHYEHTVALTPDGPILLTKV